MPNRSQLTKYPDLFKFTYWGKGPQIGNNEQSHHDVIINRNYFVGNFKIMKIITKLPRKVYRFERVQTQKHPVDHVEVYKTQDHPYIMVMSSNNLYSIDVIEKLIADGWSRIPNIYTISGESWIHYNPTLKKSEIPHHLKNEVW